MKCYYQYRPRYVPDETARHVDYDTALKLGIDESAAHQHALTLPVTTTAHSRAARLGLRGILEQIAPHPDGWTVTDMLVKSEAIVPPQRGMRSQLDAGVVFHLTPREPRPTDPYGKLHYLRHLLLLELASARTSIQNHMSTLRSKLMNVERALDHDKAHPEEHNSGINALGELQGSAPAFEAACARYASVQERLRELDAVLLDKDPIGT